jgi:hypothetical protein
VLLIVLLQATTAEAPSMTATEVLRRVDGSGDGFPATGGRRLLTKLLRRVVLLPTAGGDAASGEW